MTYEKAKAWCHVRSAIYRESNPSIKYNKNHTEFFDEIIPHEDQLADDWLEYDPADDYLAYYSMA